ncbi:MAG: GxxExxY protein [Candidatus Omnitrophica bacterium]|nr:GxxExxY protein [Candidatus Omnitrophota bacterium]
MNADKRISNTDYSDKKFLYKELSYKLIGCFYNVYNELGPAHKEQIYHEALKIIFSERAIVYKSRPKLKIHFRGKEIGIYEPDFIIEDKIIIEIKSLLNLPKVFEKQLYYYLRGTKYKVGYLVNFGNESIDIRRRIYELSRAKDLSA